MGLASSEGIERVRAAIDILRATLGAAVTTSADELQRHGQDEGWHEPCPPDAVVYAESVDDVVRTIRACAEHRVPVIPFGAGTSLEGHVAALHGGVSLDLTRMNRVLSINAQDLDCVVEAGVHRVSLNERLGREGLVFPVDPGADATIGGMVGTRASGTNAVRFGTMRDNVLGLQAVLADGTVVRTGGRARKSSAGYDLTRLLVGSEGTLGVITEVTLRLQPIPEVIGAAVCSFGTLEGAVRTAIETIQLAVPVTRIELLDEAQVAACNAYSDVDLPVQPLLLMEFQGSDAGVAEQAAVVSSIAQGHDGTGWRWSTLPEERSRLWTARHAAYYAALALRPGARAVPTDVCVPISRLADCILQTQRDIVASGLTAPIVGHVGDGNFHLLLMFDPDDAGERNRALALHGRLVRRAQAMDGTCTGEHGVGYGKLEFMEAEHGEALGMMAAIKQALDPLGILNPGKVIPSDRPPQDGGRVGS